MNWMISRWFIKINFAGLLLAVVVVGCSTKVKERTSRVAHLPFYDEATFTPKWIDPVDITDEFHHIPAFSLFNQDGEQITERRLNDKITVVDFFFTVCPGICPKMTNNMLIVQEAFKSEDDVQIFSHSVTPDYDSVSVLKEYAHLKGIENGKWQLLTGDRDMIYDLGRNQYFIEENLGLQKAPEDFIHTENFLLIDQERRIRGIYNGLNKTAIQQLIADAKALL
ncbi:SCO family protein [Reichenbachiella sp.]|uniref:SCO family protein n=1 Tax=Reichenbachiella sp. TaxID=2184521 RepID=UPI003BAEC500